MLSLYLWIEAQAKNASQSGLNLAVPS